MKKLEIKKLISLAIEPKNMCRVFFKYNHYYTYHFPIAVSDKLFYSANEDDFILNGFTIRRFSDIKKVELKDDKCMEIIKAEGIVDNLKAPDIDITDWHSVFSSLAKINNNIIVEHNSLDQSEWAFCIGKIVKVLKNKVLFKHFDTDGVWQDDYYEIPFSKITSITFGSRYVDVFSKYVSNPEC